MMNVCGPETSLTEVLALARAAGEQVLVVPAMATKRESIAEFGVALRLPAWSGHTLDALADCLHDLAEVIGPDDSPRHLIWTGVGPLREEHPRAYEGICGVLDEVSEDHPRLRVWVVEG